MHLYFQPAKVLLRGRSFVDLLRKFLGELILDSQATPCLSSDWPGLDNVSMGPDVKTDIVALGIHTFQPAVASFSTVHLQGRLILSIDHVDVVNDHSQPSGCDEARSSGWAACLLQQENHLEITMHVTQLFDENPMVICESQPAFTFGGKLVREMTAWISLCSASHMFSKALCCRSLRWA